MDADATHLVCEPPQSSGCSELSDVPGSGDWSVDYKKTKPVAAGGDGAGKSGNSEGLIHSAKVSGQYVSIRTNGAEMKVYVINPRIVRAKTSKPSKPKQVSIDLIADPQSRESPMSAQAFQFCNKVLPALFEMTAREPKKGYSTVDHFFTTFRTLAQPYGLEFTAPTPAQLSSEKWATGPNLSKYVLADITKTFPNTTPITGVPAGDGAGDEAGAGAGNDLEATAAASSHAAAPAPVYSAQVLGKRSAPLTREDRHTLTQAWVDSALQHDEHDKGKAPAETGTRGASSTPASGFSFEAPASGFSFEARGSSSRAATATFQEDRMSVSYLM